MKKIILTLILSFSMANSHSNTEVTEIDISQIAAISCSLIESAYNVGYDQARQQDLQMAGFVAKQEDKIDSIIPTLMNFMQTTAKAPFNRELCYQDIQQKIYNAGTQKNILDV